MINIYVKDYVKRMNIIILIIKNLMKIVKNVLNVKSIKYHIIMNV